MSKMAKTPRINSFLSQEAGGMTAFGLFLSMGAFVVGGLSLDLAFAYKSRAELQIAADSAAHAAIYARQENDAATAKSRAIEIARGTLPSGSYGDVLGIEDVKFGYWDADARVFTEDPNSKEAVLVSTKRFESNKNPVPTFLLPFIGVDSWDVRADSVFVTHFPPCLREGYAAEQRVDIQSNNNFYNGFCIHSNAHVEANSGNMIEPGVIVSMPDRNDLIIPSSGFTSNFGLQEALRDNRYHLRILDRMDNILKSLQTGGKYLPSYVVNPTPLTIKEDKVVGTNTVNVITSKYEPTEAEQEYAEEWGYTLTKKQVNLLQGRVYVKECKGNGKAKLTITNGAVLRDVVIITDCRLDIGSGAVLENTILFTTNTSSHSVNSASGFQLGMNDNCAPGGGSQILTYGSVHIAANLSVYNGQIIAKGNIDFSANGNGVMGANFVAGGEIDGTSNTDMGLCGTGWEDNFMVPYFRMAG